MKDTTSYLCLSTLILSFLEERQKEQKVPCMLKSYPETRYCYAYIMVDSVMDYVGAGPSGARAMAAAFAKPVGVHPLHLHPGASPRNAQDAPRVDLAFLSFVGNDPGDAVEAFERAVSLAESIPHDEAALGDRHVVRKRVVLEDDDQTAAE